MDFINQILNTAKESPNPELYYLAFAIALICVFYFVNKVLRALIFFLVIGALVLGVGAMQGKDMDMVFESIVSFVKEMRSGSTESTPARPSFGNRDEETGFQKLISDIMAKFKGGK